MAVDDPVNEKRDIKFEKPIKTSGNKGEEREDLQFFFLFLLE